MATDRRAEVRWQGSLTDGSGTIVSTTTGAIGEQPVSWAARSTDEADGVTSPEELIAAAHAACFSMALSGGLSKDGHPPDELRTSATVTFQPGEGITRIALVVEGRVPGLEGARRRPRDQPGRTTGRLDGSIRPERTSYTNPLAPNESGSSGWLRIVSTLCWTRSATSGNGWKSMLSDSGPSFACTSAFVNVSMPQSVCPITTASWVPRRWCEMRRERIVSSLTSPPAFRITCASPSSRPRKPAGSRRASMQVTTADLLPGGIGSSPFANPAA